ncbi:hypothetical protein [Brevundimonas sp. A19_0]|uniref:hypothetical protein n=1 Tax=Brevundimonas sp. A19_0 TaxID=2821087 RepID=UPI001ADBCF0A|nr:hypothetical protein [Brevundimonas sp. A19_0]MBO9502515.1 hypothetical protein [Brevundimonas sp. A19_0]
MSAAKLRLINLALAHLGEGAVSSLEDDPRPPKLTKALAQYDAVLDAALQRAPWLCAVESRTLALITPPAEGWRDWRYSSRYQLPGEYLKLWWVDGAHTFAWQAGTDLDGNGAVRRYVRAEGSEALNVDMAVRRPAEALTPLLFMAVSLDLAAHLAGPIQQADGRALLERARLAYEQAEGAEVTEIGGQAPPFAGGPLEAARRSAP